MSTGSTGATDDLWAEDCVQPLAAATAALPLIEEARTILNCYSGIHTAWRFVHLSPTMTERSARQSDSSSHTIVHDKCSLYASIDSARARRLIESS